MKAIIVDDEKLAVENLEGKLHKIERITEVHGFTDPEEALEYVKANLVDVAFLDISMQQMLGLVLAAKIREIRQECAIIFVTGYSEYAVDAFRMHVEGYLLKPVRGGADRKGVRSHRTRLYAA
ncbi:MAG TPA: response regulator [Anaerovoracaceae bacterium]|nr:response regulator [Anaerovoracaceae bacterium]